MTTPRTTEKVDIKECGCYTLRITDTWMGDTVVYDDVVFCIKHW